MTDAKHTPGKWEQQGTDVVVRRVQQKENDDMFMMGNYTYVTK
jgi:hypothetical protein